MTGKGVMYSVLIDGVEQLAYRSELMEEVLYRLLIDHWQPAMDDFIMHVRRAGRMDLLARAYIESDERTIDMIRECWIGSLVDAHDLRENTRLELTDITGSIRVVIVGMTWDYEEEKWTWEQ